MDDNQQITNLEQLIDQLDQAAQGKDEVSIGMIVDAVGSRSFGPLLLVAGLITLAPLVGDVPGVPTLMALLVLLIAIQLLFGRRQFWFPQWFLERSVARDKFAKGLAWMRKPARFIDKFLRTRLVYLTHGPGRYFIALTCTVIAAAMPPMEVVPFSANGAGIALTAFGLALIARDGLLAVIAFTVTALTIGFVTYSLA